MPAPSRQFLHHDAVALNLVQLEQDRGGRFRLFRIKRFDRPEGLARSKTTRQRRFIRPASFAGLSFLLERRGGMRKSYQSSSGAARAARLNGVRPVSGQALRNTRSIDMSLI